MPLLVMEPAVVVAESDDSLLIMSAVDAEAGNQMAYTQRYDKESGTLSDWALPFAQWLKFLYYLEAVEPPRPFIPTSTL